MSAPLLRLPLELVSNIVMFTFAQVSYCEEEYECRRIMLLVHFGEQFSADSCKATCDTCLHSKAQAHELLDMTAAARDALKVGLISC